jgi:hypothetical protein
MGRAAGAVKSGETRTALLPSALILLSQLKVANAARAKESTHAESIFVINESRKKTHYARKCEPGLGDGEKVRAVTKRNELPPFAPRLQYQKAYFTVPAQRAQQSWRYTCALSLTLLSRKTPETSAAFVSRRARLQNQRVRSSYMPEISP